MLWSPERRTVVKPIVISLDLGVAARILGGGRDRPHPCQRFRLGLLTTLAEDQPIRARQWRGVEKHEMRDAMRMPGRVLGRQNATPLVAHERDLFEPKVPSKSVEILDLGVDRNVFGGDASGGPPAASLVVVDQPDAARQSVHLGQKIEMVEVGAAVEDEERGTRAHLPYEETGAGNRHLALAGTASHCAPCWRDSASRRSAAAAMPVVSPAAAAADSAARDANAVRFHRPSCFDTRASRRYVNGRRSALRVGAAMARSARSDAARQSLRSSAIRASALAREYVTEYLSGIGARSSARERIASASEVRSSCSRRRARVSGTRAAASAAYSGVTCRIR